MDRNLEVHTRLLHYWTFGLGAGNDAQTVREKLTEKITTSRIYQK